MLETDISAGGLRTRPDKEGTDVIGETNSGGQRKVRTESRAPLHALRDMERNPHLLHAATHVSRSLSSLRTSAREGENVEKLYLVQTYLEHR
jgi:hypothetical protein